MRSFRRISRRSRSRCSCASIRSTCRCGASGSSVAEPAGALAEFADWDTARRASELVGRELFVEADEERSDDEFYMEDLIGFAADVDGRQGEVTDYYDSEANPLLGVTIDGREYLVPARPGSSLRRSISRAGACG